MSKWNDMFKSQEEKKKIREAILKEYEDIMATTNDYIDALNKKAETVKQSDPNLERYLSNLSLVVNDMKQNCICSNDQSSSKIKMATNVLERLHEGLAHPTLNSTERFLTSVTEFKKSRPLEFSQNANLFEARFHTCIGALFSISAISFGASAVLAPVLSPLSIIAASLSGIAAIGNFNLATQYYKDAKIAVENARILDEKTAHVSKVLDNWVSENTKNEQQLAITFTQNYKSNLRNSFTEPSVQIIPEHQLQKLPSSKELFEIAFKAAHEKSSSEVINRSSTGGYTIATSPPNNNNIHLTVSKEGAVTSSSQPKSKEDKQELAAKMVAAFVAAGNEQHKSAQIHCKDPELSEILKNTLNKKGYEVFITIAPEEQKNESHSASNNHNK